MSAHNCLADHVRARPVRTLAQAISDYDRITDTDRRLTGPEVQERTRRVIRLKSYAESHVVALNRRAQFHVVR